MQRVWELNSNDEIEVFGRGELNMKIAFEYSLKLLVAFPKLEQSFLQLLVERCKANGFTDARFIESVNHCLDNYTGWDKQPAISDFLQFNKKVPTFTYKQLLEEYSSVYTYGNTYDPINTLYVRISTNANGVRYIKKEDSQILEGI